MRPTPAASAISRWPAKMVSIDEGARCRAGVFFLDEEPVLKARQGHQGSVRRLKDASQDERQQEQPDALAVVDQQQT